MSREREGRLEDLATPGALFAAIEERLQARHGSPRTAEAYVRWVRRFIAFAGRRHPKDLGPMEVEAFLSALATKEHVSASTQNQALAALLFLYKEVLDPPFGYLEGIVHAKRPKRLPVVLSRGEVKRLFDELTPPRLLMAELLYASGFD
jgi:site-specific recombinase XerD